MPARLVEKEPTLYLQHRQWLQYYLNTGAAPFHNPKYRKRDRMRSSVAFCSSLFHPIEGRGLDGRLAGVAQLLLPARVDLVGVLLEGQESALELLVGLRVLDNAPM